jgi:hypothetical protein
MRTEKPSNSLAQNSLAIFIRDGCPIAISVDRRAGDCRHIARAVRWLTTDRPALTRYLARYLTGGPISDGRLIDHRDGKVTFWARGRVPVSAPARPRVQRNRVLALGRHVHDACAVDQDLVLDAGLGIDVCLAVADRHGERRHDPVLFVGGDG